MRSLLQRTRAIDGGSADFDSFDITMRAQWSSAVPYNTNGLKPPSTAKASPENLCTMRSSIVSTTRKTAGQNVAHRATRGPQRGAFAVHCAGRTAATVCCALRCLRGAVLLRQRTADSSEHAQQQEQERRVSANTKRQRRPEQRRPNGTAQRPRRCGATHRQSRARHQKHGRVAQLTRCTLFSPQTPP